MPWSSSFPSCGLPARRGNRSCRGHRVRRRRVRAIASATGRRAGPQMQTKQSIGPYMTQPLLPAVHNGPTGPPDRPVRPVAPPSLATFAAGKDDRELGCQVVPAGSASLRKPSRWAIRPRPLEKRRRGPRAAGGRNGRRAVHRAVRPGVCPRGKRAQSARLSWRSMRRRPHACSSGAVRERAAA